MIGKCIDMSRIQPSRVTKSVAFASLSENKLKAASRSYDENDEIPTETTCKATRNKTKTQTKIDKDSGVRTHGEIAWTLKEVVNVYGETHDLYYADNGENFNSKGW